MIGKWHMAIELKFLIAFFEMRFCGNPIHNISRSVRAIGLYTQDRKWLFFSVGKNTEPTSDVNEML